MMSDEENGPRDLRDWFAGQALHGLAATVRGFQANGPTVASDDEARQLAEAAYSLADAMLEARGKETLGSHRRPRA